METDTNNGNIISHKDLRYVVNIAIDTNKSALLLAELLQSFKAVSKDTSSVVSASEELSASVREISNNVHNVSNDATLAEERINQSIGVADNAISAMQEIANTSSEAAIQIGRLSETSRNITQILKTINDISKQTHLLALNATIEAARAGEAGKGFTVVAKEVKNLAEQTSRATEEIRKHTDQLNSDMGEINQITMRNSSVVNEGQQMISDTVNLLRASAESIGEVSHKMQEVSIILDQQNDATKEIAQNITNVSNSTNANIRVAEYSAQATTTTNKTIQDGIMRFAPKMNDKDLCEMAKFDHILFKKKVIDAFLGLIDCKPEDLTDHNNCRLGKWYNTVTNPKIKNLPEFKSLLEPHIDFHQYGKDALKALNMDKIKEAIDIIHKLEETSEIVLDLLTKLADSI